MTKLETLVTKIKKFNKARGWHPVSADIAKSVVIEASELLEHFQWDESDKDVKGTQPKDWVKVGEEVADVFWYLSTFCNSADIKLEKVIADKIAKNEKKYPVEMFNGKHNDKFYKDQKRKYREARGKT
jgi:NTP pyrophosphatase (non-canonical NTP hydrolase)